MLEALAAFMPVDETGVGALKYTKNERKKIAQKSRDYKTQKFGSLVEHEKLINQQMESRPNSQREQLNSKSQEEKREKGSKDLQRKEEQQELLRKAMEEEKLENQKNDPSVSDQTSAPKESLRSSGSQKAQIDNMLEGRFSQKSKPEAQEDKSEEIDTNKKSRDHKEEIQGVQPKDQFEQRLVDILDQEKEKNSTFTGMRQLLTHCRELDTAIKSVKYEPITTPKEIQGSSELESRNKSENKSSRRSKASSTLLDSTFCLIMIILVSYMVYFMLFLKF